MSSQDPNRVRVIQPRRLAVAAAALLALGACEGSDGLSFLKRGDAPPPEVTAAAPGSASLIERDVEAPEVFEASEPGLWDGRPSLGGVWAAHPDVADPERVIIRNEENGKFVIGALFRKERDTPGPKLQISSDAASELGLLAGNPTNVYVVALRRESVADPAILNGEPPADGFAEPAVVAEATLDVPAQPVAEAAGAAAVAAAVLDTPETVTDVSTPAPEVQLAAAVEPAPAAPVSKLDRPYLQIGIFSVEQNAQNTAQVMRGAGIVPTVLEQNSSGKTFWRVIVGPAQTRSEQRALLETIRGKGFKDAYAVTN